MSAAPRVLLVIPPMTQLNTPYPATAHLTGFLRGRGIEAAQCDLALELVLRLFSATGIDRIAMRVARLPKAKRRTDSLRWFEEEYPRIRVVVEPVLRYLQGKDSSLAHRIVANWLPEGPRSAAIDALDANFGDGLGWAFGALGAADRAKYLATLFLDELADVVRDAIDPRFAFVRYAESLADSQPSFEPMAEALAAPPTLVDELLSDLALEALSRHKPDLVGFSTPFPGCVYAAFRLAQAMKKAQPSLRTMLGGGWANTELRTLKEPRVFDTFDYITLDDGERPLLCLVEHLRGERSEERLFRTFLRKQDEVVWVSDPQERDVPFAELPPPTYDGLPLDRYLSVLEMLNPMHRLWSDARWNKLMVAHGCYWKKCSFCDVSLDYIGRYDPASAARTVDRMEALIAETGTTGFHLVDEAAPPAGLRAMAEELLRRGLVTTWWGNLRFEKTFTSELARLLAASGCVAVTGGLEVASDRLLQKMNKGVSVAQVAKVTRAFSDAGVLVHAYLMYGFPTQTVQETVDALEYVRQLFKEECLHSAFWHRFAATVHSPVGKDPGSFGVRIPPIAEVKFSINEVPFEDPTGVDHDRLGVGLNKALYNFQHGVGLEEDVRSWFEDEVPPTTVPPDFVVRAISGTL